MKDYIDIYGDNNNSSTMEAVCTFELNNSSFIIYSDLDKNHYYLSKYDKDNNLITDISEDELNKANSIFMEVMNETRN
jgi:hypothetical protein